MRGSGFSSSCLWLAISVFITSFFIIVDSNINRGLTTASARFQAFKGNLILNVLGFKKQNHCLDPTQVKQYAWGVGGGGQTREEKSSKDQSVFSFHSH